MFEDLTKAIEIIEQQYKVGIDYSKGADMTALCMVVGKQAEAVIKALSEYLELTKAKADGRLVERGTWINGYCSNCNSPIPTDNKDDYIAKSECRFCYYCGAKMEEAEKALEVGE